MPLTRDQAVKDDLFYLVIEDELGDSVDLSLIDRGACGADEKLWYDLGFGFISLSEKHNDLIACSAAVERFPLDHAVVPFRRQPKALSFTPAPIQKLSLDRSRRVELVTPIGPDLEYLDHDLGPLSTVRLNLRPPNQISDVVGYLMRADIIEVLRKVLSGQDTVESELQVVAPASFLVLAVPEHATCFTIKVKQDRYLGNVTGKVGCGHLQALGDSNPNRLQLVDSAHQISATRST